MFNNGKVVDTSYEVECDNGVWVVASYVTYQSGRRIRNWVADGPTQDQAYGICNHLRLVAV